MSGAGSTKGDEAVPPLLLYDGLCGFCDGTVRFLLRHDRVGKIRFAPLQGATAAGLLERHPGLRGVDSLVLVEGPPGSESVSVRSEAALRIAAHLGGWWRLAAAARLIPRPLRDAGYDLFARHRYRFFGRLDACAMPEPGARGRFLP